MNWGGSNRGGYYSLKRLNAGMSALVKVTAKSRKNVSWTYRTNVRCTSKSEVLTFDLVSFFSQRFAVSDSFVRKKSLSVLVLLVGLASCFSESDVPRMVAEEALFALLNQDSTKKDLFMEDWYDRGIAWMAKHEPGREETVSLQLDYEHGSEDVRFYTFFETQVDGFVSSCTIVVGKEEGITWRARVAKCGSTAKRP